VLGCITFRRSCSRDFKMSCIAHTHNVNGQNSCLDLFTLPACRCKLLYEVTTKWQPSFTCAHLGSTLAIKAGQSHAYPMFSTPKHKGSGVRLLGWIYEFWHMCALLPLQRSISHLKEKWLYGVACSVALSCLCKSSTPTHENSFVGSRQKNHNDSKKN
jgi:hypothetical protein